MHAPEPNMDYSRFGEASGLSRAAHEEVGLFSMDRWGVGSLFMIGAFLATGMIFLFRWIGTRGLFSLTTAVLLLMGGGIILVVKATESIERVEHRGYDPVGKTGVVTITAAGGKVGSVRVDGMDWSARSREALEVGDEVVVASREGLHLTVEKRKRRP